MDKKFLKELKTLFAQYDMELERQRLETRSRKIISMVTKMGIPVYRLGEDGAAGSAVTLTNVFLGIPGDEVTVLDKASKSMESVKLNQLCMEDGSSFEAYVTELAKELNLEL